jgi:hypothetical protein
MEGKTNDKIENSEKINNEICDPATQEKKLIELSPGNPESNKMKKIKSKKLNTILKKESRVYFGINKNQNQKSLGIKWDNKAIDEQNAYRQRHRLSTIQRHKMKSVSQTKYNSAVIGVEDDDYLKNLIKVNQIKVTDELIKNIIKIFNEPKEYKKVRNNSTRIKTPFRFDFHSNAIRSAAKNINFDGVLDLESKITLQNTIINKFHKEVLGTNDEIRVQDLNLA